MDNHYNLIILGGGPGGYNAAEHAAHAKMSTMLIEKRALGGVCLNEGCIPTKTLLYSAKLYHGAKDGQAYGVTTTNAKLDHAAVIARKDKVVQTLVSGVAAKMKSSGVTIVFGEGVLQGRDENGYIIQVDDEIYTADRLIIATGSSPTLPPIEGLADGIKSGFIMTNREILDMTALPEHLVVVGGGVIGLEMANYFAIAGVHVTVVEALDHIAGQNDPDIIRLMQKNFEKMGVTFHLSSMVRSFAPGKINFTNAKGEMQQIEADKVLFSIGRRPNITNIGLESINVLTERGAIVTDDTMKTNQPEVYAIGDVNGKSMLAHTAYREGEVAIARMQGKNDRMLYNVIAGVVYTNPEIASVGETEQTAKDNGIDVRVIRIPMQYSGRYIAENEGGNGIFKLIFDQKTGVLIGAQAYANYSSEFIIAASMMIQMSMSARQMQKFVYPHPTVCEIIREAAFQY